MVSCHGVCGSLGRLGGLPRDLGVHPPAAGATSGGTCRGAVNEAIELQTSGESYLTSCWPLDGRGAGRVYAFRGEGAVYRLQRPGCRFYEAGLRLSEYVSRTLDVSGASPQSQLTSTSCCKKPVLS